MGPLGGQKANFGPLVKTAGGASWAPGLPNGTPGGSKNGRRPGGLCLGFLTVLIFRGPPKGPLLSKYA